MVGGRQRRHKVRVFENRALHGKDRSSFDPRVRPSIPAHFSLPDVTRLPGTRPDVERRRSHQSTVTLFALFL